MAVHLQPPMASRAEPSRSCTCICCPLQVRVLRNNGELMFTNHIKTAVPNLLNNCVSHCAVTLQVRVLRDYGEIVFTSGKVSLQRGKSHWLPKDEVRGRAGRWLGGKAAAAGGEGGWERERESSGSRQGRRAGNRGRAAMPGSAAGSTLGRAAMHALFSECLSCLPSVTDRRCTRLSWTGCWKSWLATANGRQQLAVTSAKERWAARQPDLT